MHEFPLIQDFQKNRLRLDRFCTDHMAETYAMVENLNELEEYIRTVPVTKQSQGVIQRMAEYIADARKEMARLNLGFIENLALREEYERTVENKTMISDIKMYRKVLIAALTQEKEVSELETLKDIVGKIVDSYGRLPAPPIESSPNPNS